MAAKSIELPDLEATASLGRWIGKNCFPGAVIALIGPLGAGKTHLARFVAEGLGVADSRIVTSPTFVLLQEYQSRLPIYHVDAYRLASEAAFEELGSREFMESEGVCLIEWADRILGSLPEDKLIIQLEYHGSTSRKAHLEAGSKHERLIPPG